MCKHLNIFIVNIALLFVALFCLGNDVLAAGPPAPVDIHGFISKGEVQQLKFALKNGANLNSLDSMDRTALMLAAQEGKLEILLLLVLQRVDVNFKNAAGKTAIMFACEGNQFDSVAILIQAGADVNAINKAGKSVLNYTEQPGYERLNAYLKEQGVHIPKIPKVRSESESGISGRPEMDVFYKIKVHYATNRKPQNNDTLPLKGFSNHPDNILHYGTCEVSIPKNHRSGEMESANPLLLQFTDDPSKHVVLMRVTELDAESYFEVIKNSLKDSAEKDVLLFIHGFNVGFSEAARLGQIDVLVVRRGKLPRHPGQVFQIGPGHGMLRRHGVDPLQPL